MQNNSMCSKYWMLSSHRNPFRHFYHHSHCLRRISKSLECSFRFGTWIHPCRILYSWKVLLLQENRWLDWILLDHEIHIKISNLSSYFHTWTRVRIAASRLGRWTRASISSILWRWRVARSVSVFSTSVTRSTAGIIASPCTPSTIYYKKKIHMKIIS